MGASRREDRSIYTQVGQITESARVEILEALPKDRTTRGRLGGTYYETTGRFDAGDVDVPIPRPWHSTFGVIIPPGGVLHTHTHPDDHKLQRWIVVVSTNPKCVCTNGDVEAVLEDLGVYRLESGLPHGAVNNGETERVHMIVETLK